MLNLVHQIFVEQVWRSFFLVEPVVGGGGGWMLLLMVPVVLRLHLVDDDGCVGLNLTFAFVVVVVVVVVVDVVVVVAAVVVVVVAAAAAAVAAAVASFDSFAVVFVYDDLQSLWLPIFVVHLVLIFDVVGLLDLVGLVGLVGLASIVVAVLIYFVRFGVAVASFLPPLSPSHLVEPC